ncbi:MAG: TlyA family RNA methyltransferase, partial [Candidatus Omnitrophica bacterium]|nr:TlyA family RNA methyltransferase [Candidatus Omnitrophota bacterium]
MAPSPGKVRLDILLLERGLVESRARAQAYIAAGHVFHKTERLLKCGQMVPADLELRIELPYQDVSRGAAKLRGALEHFRFSAHGRVAADLGASTGGFTQVLLEQGAMRVHAVDVGYGLLHERLRRDSRVILHEKTNARFLTEYDLEPIDIAVMDLSFIGLELILPAVSRITHFSSDCVALIKPQFE